MKAIAPNGLSITGTKDFIPAEATIAEGSFKKGADGKLEFNWSGLGSIIHWDDQKTATDNGGERLFYDADGNAWPESRIQIVGGDEEDED